MSKGKRKQTVDIGSISYPKKDAPSFVGVGSGKILTLDKVVLIMDLTDIDCAVYFNLYRPIKVKRNQIIDLRKSGQAYSANDDPATLIILDNGWWIVSDISGLELVKKLTPMQKVRDFNIEIKSLKNKDSDIGKDIEEEIAKC